MKEHIHISGLSGWEWWCYLLRGVLLLVSLGGEGEMVIVVSSG